MSSGGVTFPWTSPAEDKEEEKIFIEEEEEKDSSTTRPKHYFSSYTYSNFPFTMTKFSQYNLAHEGPFKSSLIDL